MMSSLKIEKLVNNTMQGLGKIKEKSEEGSSKTRR
jgi:hypothetical protein